jgi:hypothetical protein
LSWTVPEAGKLPGTYYYRAKTVTSSRDSSWSNVQSVRVYPLFVGLKVRYDGMGYIRGLEYYDIGWHETIALDALSDADTVRAQFHGWYDPNPLGFEESFVTSYYSVTSGDWKSSNVPDDPSWKWGASWKLAYESAFTNGSTVQIGGQNFTVSGPKSGTTTYGKSIAYWEFMNQDQFLIYENGDAKQYVRPGEAILRYDAGASRLQVYSNVTRHFYYQGEDIGESVQYVINLTAANSLPGSPGVVMGAESVDAMSGDASPTYQLIPTPTLTRQPMLNP